MDACKAYPKKWRTLLLCLYVPLFLCLVSPPDASGGEERNWELFLETTLSGEYNDNIHLENDADEETDEDFILHFMPSIQGAYGYKDHRIRLNADMDYRRGLQTETSDLNISLLGEVDLRFSGGLKTRLYDEYYETRFDRDLEWETGIYRSRGNAYGLEASYAVVERLKFEGEYEHGWEEFDYDGSVSDLIYDDFMARAEIPVTWSMVSYLSYGYYARSSDEGRYLDYEDTHYRAGVKWTGPYRFSLTAGGGYETVEFDAPGLEDYENYTLEAVLGVKYTEQTDGKFSAGLDGYGNFNYAGELNFKYSDETNISALMRKKTYISYSSAALPVYEATEAVLKYQTRFYDRFTWRMEGRWQLQSYDRPVTASDGPETEDREDETWVGRAEVYYPFGDHYKAGVHYQHARRFSDLERYDYENNRIGLFFTVNY